MLSYSRGKTVARLVYSMDQFSCQSKVGDILVTAARNAYDGPSFVTSVNKLKKEIRKLFEKGVSIVTRSDAGRLHVHIAVQLPVSCTSFDWNSFEESERYYGLYKTFRDAKDLRFFRYYTKKYRSSMPPEWIKANRKLMLLGKRYGLGRVFLTPVRKNLPALKWYYVGNIPYTRDDRDKGIHYFTNWGMKNISGFQVLNKFTKTYRRRLSKFCQGLQLTSNDYNILLRSVLGRRWYYKCKDLIANVESMSAEQTAEYNELKSAVRTYLIRSS